MEGEGGIFHEKILAVFLVLALLLTGCSETVDDSVLRADAEVLLSTFLEKDYDTCRGIVRRGISDANLQGIFDDICRELEGLGTYEMSAVAWNRKMSEGHDVTSVQYLVESEVGKFYLSVAREENVPGLAGFQFSEAAADAESVTPAGPAHWAFIAVGGAVIGFVIWMIVDCTRRRMKRKWLWMPLILLGTLILTLTMGQGGMNFRFQIGLYLGITNLITFARGGYRVMLYLPLGAIVYFAKRKVLTAQGEEEDHAEGEEEASAAAGDAAADAAG